MDLQYAFGSTDLISANRRVHACCVRALPSRGLRRGARAFGVYALVYMQVPAQGTCLL